jgi:hypothetical protein
VDEVVSPGALPGLDPSQHCGDLLIPTTVVVRKYIQCIGTQGIQARVVVATTIYLANNAPCLPPCILRIFPFPCGSPSPQLHRPAYIHSRRLKCSSPTWHLSLCSIPCLHIVSIFPKRPSLFNFSILLASTPGPPFRAVALARQAQNLDLVADSSIEAPSTVHRKCFECIFLSRENCGRRSQGRRVSNRDRKGHFCPQTSGTKQQQERSKSSAARMSIH